MKRKELEEKLESQAVYINYEPIEDIAKQIAQSQKK